MLPSAGENLRSSDSSDTSTPPKVIKRDNIVLGISDLKQQQKRASIEGPKSPKISTKKVVVDKEKKETTPVTTIKVTNCEIINSRPRSVTAAIFGHPTILTPQKKKKLEVKIPIIKKAEKQIFRPLQQGHPTSVTSTIFAPRTKDMNPGYLMFSEDTDTGLTSKLKLKTTFCEMKFLPKKKNILLDFVHYQDIKVVGQVLIT